MKHSEAVNVKVGQTLYFSRGFNADGSPQRWKVNGKVRRWKRDSLRLEIPVKHGLYDYAVVKTADLPYFFLSEKDAEDFYGKEAYQYND